MTDADRIKGLQADVRTATERIEHWQRQVLALRRDLEAERAAHEKTKAELELAYADCHDGLCGACVRCFDAERAGAAKLREALEWFCRDHDALQGGRGLCGDKCLCDGCEALATDAGKVTT